MSQNDILSDYLQSLYGIDPLPVAEEHRLAKLIKQGDHQALEKLIKHNLRFVVYVVRKLSAWQYGKVPVEDILGMGNEALFMACRSWKPTNNSGLATSAKPYILRSVLRDLNNTANMIRLPVNIMLDIKKLKYTERNLTQVLGREPKKSEIAKILGITKGRIDELQAHIMREPMGLNDPKKDEHFEDSNDD